MGGQQELIPTFERLLYTMRLYLGHSNTGLGPGDLLGTLVKDAQRFLPDNAGLEPDVQKETRGSLDAVAVTAVGAPERKGAISRCRTEP